MAKKQWLLSVTYPQKGETNIFIWIQNNLKSIWGFQILNPFLTSQTSIFNITFTDLLLGKKSQVLHNPLTFKWFFPIAVEFWLQLGCQYCRRIWINKSLKAALISFLISSEELLLKPNLFQFIEVMPNSLACQFKQIS